MKLIWTRDHRGDYYAEAGGISFKIHKCTDYGTPFGLTACRKSDGKQLQNDKGWGIAWARSKKNCVAMAEQILAAHGAP